MLGPVLHECCTTSKCALTLITHAPNPAPHQCYHVYRFALPEGTTRENVKLTVNPSNSIRVAVSAASTAAAGGGGGAGPDRPVYKDVVLPKDALLTEISAKFEAEQHRDEKRSAEEGGEKAMAGGGGSATREGAVAGVEVTVGKASPPQPKNVEIL